MANPLDTLFDEMTEPVAPVGGARAADPLGALFDEMTEPADRPRGVLERLSAVGQGATAGLAQMLPTTGGAFTGAAVGAAVGGPPGAVVGLGAGLVAGHMAGGELQKRLSQVRIPGTDTAFTFDDISSVPIDLRPYAVGGETLGQASSFLGLPFAMAQQGVRLGTTAAPQVAEGAGRLSRGAQHGWHFVENLPARMVNAMVDSARQAPQTFAIAETTLALGAGVGAGVAEAALPGDPWARVGGEILGALMNPARTGILAYEGSKYAVRRVAQAFSPAARREDLARQIQGALLRLGEDPAQLAPALRTLREQWPELAALTPGQISGSEGLLALERAAAARSGEFGRVSQRGFEESMQALRMVVDTAIASGNPEAIRAAAQIRSRHFEALLTARMDRAVEQMETAATAVRPGDATSTADFGRQAQSIMEDTISELRRVEREVWEATDLSGPAGARTVMDAIDNMQRTRRLPVDADQLPPVVREMRELFEEQAATGETTRELLWRFRSRMLEEARGAAGGSNPNYRDAGIYGDLAAAALEDIAASGDDPALALARDYSFRLNETFNRTFAGAITARDASGAESLVPEVVMRRAFGSGREIAEAQFRQMQDAAAMAGSELLTRTLDVQERTLRSVARSFADPGTGQVNARAFGRWRRDNADLLRQFPELNEQFGSIESAQRWLDTVRRGEPAARRLFDQSVFARVARAEDPTRAVGAVLEGEQPVAGLTRLVRLARTQGEEGQRGLEASVLAHFRDRSTDAAGDFSFRRLREELRGRITPAGRPTHEVLVEAGAFPREHMDQVLRAMDMAVRVEDARRLGVSLDAAEVGGVTDFMYDFANRILGAKAAAGMPTGGAHSLIVGHAGSRLARQVMDKVPKRRTQEMLLEALRPENTALLETLLTTPTSATQRLELSRRANLYLWNLGFQEGLRPEFEEFVE